MQMAAASTRRYASNSTLSPVDGIFVVVKDEFPVVCSVAAFESINFTVYWRPIKTAWTERSTATWPYTYDFPWSLFFTGSIKGSALLWTEHGAVNLLKHHSLDIVPTAQRKILSSYCHTCG